MTAAPRPEYVAELRGNTVRLAHGPIRLTINTEQPLPSWAWQEVAALSEHIDWLATRLAGTPLNTQPASAWVQVHGTTSTATAEQFATVDATPGPVDTEPECNIGSGDPTTDVVPTTTQEPAPEPKARKPQGSKYDWAEVADIINTARRAGQSSTEALAAEYDANRTTAQWMVTECRRRGHQIVPATNTGRRGNGVKSVIVGQDRGPIVAPAKVVAPARKPATVEAAGLTAGLAEAAASVALDGETISVGPSTTTEPVEPTDAELATIEADDDEYEPLTWGVNGESPPKVEHWSRHEDEG